MFCLLNEWSCDKVIGCFRGVIDILCSSKICSNKSEYSLVDFTAVTSHFYLLQALSLINSITFFVYSNTTLCMGTIIKDCKLYTNEEPFISINTINMKFSITQYYSLESNSFGAIATDCEITLMHLCASIQLCKKLCIKKRTVSESNIRLERL